MHSPPHPEGSSRTTGGVLHGNAAGNTFRFADHTSSLKIGSIVGVKKAIIRLYTTTLDPTIAHTGGVEGLQFIKAKVPMNIYLHSVLQSLSALDSSIHSRWKVILSRS